MCIAQSAAEIVLARRAGRDSKILLSRVSTLSRERERGDNEVCFGMHSSSW